MKDKSYPLILVFYLYRLLMNEKEIMTGFAEAVNNTIAEREANAMAFFIPTDDKERVECINPLIATDEQKEKIDKLIEAVSKTFDIGQGADEEYY